MHKSKFYAHRKRAAKTLVYSHEKKPTHSYTRPNESDKNGDEIEITRRVYEHFILYSNSRAWSYMYIWMWKAERLSEFLKKNHPSRRVALLADNCGTHILSQKLHGAFTNIGFGKIQRFEAAISQKARITETERCRTNA